VLLALADGFASQALLELSADERELALTVHAPEPTYFFNVLLDGIRRLLHTRWPGLTYDLLVPCQHRLPGPGGGAVQRRCPGRFHRDALVQLHQRDEPTLPCPVCGTTQDVPRLLTAVAAPRGPEPGGTPELNARLIQALQGGLQQVVRAELGPIADRLGSIDTRLDTGLTQIAQSAEYTRAQLQRWTIRYETTSGTPRLFTLTPVTKHGLDKAAVWQDGYQLTLWCEHADQPHPWPPARYQFSRPSDWLVTVAPYAIGVLQVLRVAAKVGMPIATLADVNLKGVKDDLETMGTLLQQLPTPSPAHRSADPGQPVGAVEADGPELRALRALLFELDPKRTFNGMHVVADKPGGDVRWVCQDHYPAYNPGRPFVPA
jgi:internalin A